MSEILNLAMPFFGLIVLGVFASRRWQVGEHGLAWLNIFLVYFSLPALIFLVVAAAPFEQLINWPFVTATTSVTVFAFLAIVILSRILFATPLKTATLQGTAGSYGNVGYMGLPLSVAFFGPEAAVPAALVFCFDCAVQFIMTAFLATLAHERNEEAHWGEVSLRIVKQVVSHPFIIATALGRHRLGAGVQGAGRHRHHAGHADARGRANGSVCARRHRRHAEVRGLRT